MSEIPKLRSAIEALKIYPTISHVKAGGTTFANVTIPKDHIDKVHPVLEALQREHEMLGYDADTTSKGDLRFSVNLSVLDSIICAKGYRNPVKEPLMAINRLLQPSGGIVVPSM